MDNNGTRQTHESFGLLSFSRTTSSGQKPLFGSSIEHGNTVTMRLNHADVKRDLHTDWYHSTGRIVEVEMSSAQFAELITSLNQGEGVPCTIRWLQGEGRIEDPPFESKMEIHRKEFSAHQDSIKEDFTKIFDSIQELFAKKNLTKEDKKNILRDLQRLYNAVIPNTEYQIEMFEEQMAKTVTEAKAEIESFVQNKLIAFANETLIHDADKLNLLKSESTDVISLGVNEDETDN